jgi:archaellum component FlaF (FlaF/FlaG flagellin family)
MSAGMGSNTSTIYVNLLDEGTTVVRPTQGALLGNNVYRVLATPDYDPDDEHWQFPPGSIVRCVIERRDGEDVLVAHEAVSSP